MRWNMSAFKKEKYVCKWNMCAFQKEKGIYAVKYVRISFCQPLKLSLHLISSFHLSFWQSKKLLLNIWHQTKKNPANFELSLLKLPTYIDLILKVLMTFLWGNVYFSLETKVLLDKNGRPEEIFFPPQKYSFCTKSWKSFGVVKYCRIFLSPTLTGLTQTRFNLAGNLQYCFSLNKYWFRCSSNSYLK